MSNDPEEIPLSGGNINTVVRIGETVRRRMGPQSASVHAFLRHLEVTKFPAPRVLGVDDSGREILSYIEGETSFPSDLWEADAALVHACELLRALHDASCDFVPPSKAKWAYEYPDASRREVICHNDFAPYNMVFRDGVPTAVLDFDLCGPGPRLRDLAYLAYWLTPLSFGSNDLKPISEADVRNNCRRLRLICSSYGGQRVTDLLPMVSEVLHHMGDYTAAHAMVGTQAVDRLKADGHLDHWAREAVAFDAMRPVLETAVT